MRETDPRAVERWRDPELHGATDRPLTFVVGAYRMAEGDYENAERLFRDARSSVPRVSLWRIQLDWYLLRCRRHLREEASPEDRLEVIELGGLLQRFGHAGSPELLRYLGLAYNLMGNHASAIACLREAVRSVSGADGWEVVAALASTGRSRADTPRRARGGPSRSHSHAGGRETALRRLAKDGAVVGGFTAQRKPPFLDSPVN
jgi:tetratricopeptide (TPR) repeat protein